MTEHTLSGILFPRRCPVCGRITVPRGAYICPECRKKLSFVRQPCCMKCGKELAAGEEEYCFDCQRYGHHFDYGIALLNYEDRARKLIADFKYRNQRTNADFLAAELAAGYGKRIKAMAADALVPVPLYRRKRRLRGFNQSEVLAKKLGKWLDIPVCTNLLLRVHDTKPQKELDHSQRVKNLSGAIAVGEGCRAPERIVLVDDIYTTGSTADACAEVLRASGARKIFLVCACIGRDA